jgi:hypothetical protein
MVNDRSNDRPEPKAPLNAASEARKNLFDAIDIRKHSNQRRQALRYAIALKRSH